MEDENFWTYADELVRTSEIVIDRPGGSRHPRYPDVIYPLDYGYLSDTSAGDGEGIDVWAGSLGGSALTGVIAAIDVVQRDAEIKLLIGCTDDETTLALSTHRQGSQDAIFIRRAVQ